MSPQFVISLFREVVLTTGLLAAPMLAAGLVVGLTMGIFQSITSIQELTLTFIPKMVAVTLALIIALPWMINILLTFSSKLFINLAAFSR